MTSPDWLRADWSSPPGVIAGTTLRHGGVSAGAYTSLNLGAQVGDSPEAVRVNRQRFGDACDLPASPFWLRQVHGRRVLTDASAANAPSRKFVTEVPERGAREFGDELSTRGIRNEPADAIVTGRPGVVCAVLTADCLPVVIAAATGDEIGVAHAGWRGLSAGILEATVDAFITPAPRLLAWLGPAISQAAFEVGDDVRQQFVGTDADAARHFRENARGRWQADLYGLARLRLGQAGITEIHGGGRCTWSEPEAFFSYRRDGQCGRMATFAFRRKTVR